LLTQLIQGNVQVDPAQLATTHDLTISSDRETTIHAYRALHDTLLTSKGLIQLSHPGLQSHILTFSSPFTRPVSSISARPTLGSGVYATVIGHVLYPVKARVLAMDEWCDIVSLFVKSAVIMRDAGWQGVQIHSAHGYLLAAYLSKLVRSFHTLERLFDVALTFVRQIRTHRHSPMFPPTSHCVSTFSTSFSPQSIKKHPTRSF
jgi:2,4-dienoyl-CoA reductase-like NADH-dependent reductase (Old Yellow Enzyme family)